MDTYEYIRKTDELIRDLRNRHLGLNRKLDDLMPPQLVCGKSEAKASCLANRLLFMMLRKSGADQTELNVEQSYCWLYEAALYLFERCRWEDQTFAGMLKLIGLKFGVRAILFGKIENERKYEHLRTDTACPFRKDNLEAVFVEFLPRKEIGKRLSDLRALIDQT